MSVTAMRNVLTAAGATPVAFNQRDLLKEMIVQASGTPNQQAYTYLLRQLITQKGGTPTQFNDVYLLRELVTLTGGTPATYDPDRLWAQVVLATDPSAGYALYLPFSAASPTYRVGASTYSPVMALPGYSYTRSGVKGEVTPATVITYGAELVSNGTFDTVTTGWTAGIDATLSVVGARMRITAVAGTGGATADQAVTLVAGGVYRMLNTLWASDPGKARNQDTSGGSNWSLQLVVGSGPTTNDLTFRTGSNIIITIGAASGGAWAAAGQYAEVDDVSVKRIITAPVVMFGANEPAIIPGVGYWSRGALTNLLLQSQALDDAAWSDGGATATANTTVAPDGTTTADTLTASVAVALRSTSGSSAVVAGSTYTTSVFIPAGGTSLYAVLQVFGSASGSFITVDRSTGAVGASQSLGGTMPITGYAVAVGTGWRVIAVHTMPAGETLLSVSVGLSETANARASSVGKTMPAWQSQTLLGNHPSGGPIIPTVAATAAVGADVQSHTQTAPTDVDQVFFAKINHPAPIGVQYVMSLSDATAVNRIVFYLNAGVPTADVVVASVSQHAPTLAAITASQDTILVIRRLAGNWRFGKIVSGVLTWAASGAGTFPTGMVNNAIGMRYDSIAQLDGVVLNDGHKVGTFTTDAEVIAAATI